MDERRRTYEIRLVTPAFVAGADQQAPELRVPSIRGCLRWWFRLAQKGADASSDATGRAEEEIFGSMSTGQRLTVRLHEIRRGKEEQLVYQTFGFDHKYLWFPLRPGRGVSNPIARPPIPAETLVRLDVIVAPGVANAAATLKRMDEVVSHWVLFGGIGMRSRRCAGSLWFASRLPSGEPLPSGREDIQRLLESAQGTLRSAIDFKVSPRPFPSWRRALEDVGDHYRGQRKNVKDSRGRKALPALGWPIMNFEGVKDTKLEVDGRESERLASPVLLKVIPDSKQFRWLLVVIRRPFVDLIKSGEGEVRSTDVLGGFADGFESATGPRPPGSGSRGPQRR